MTRTLELAGAITVIALITAVVALVAANRVEHHLPTARPIVVAP